jgi:Zn finger protein HypA/HybF involved in hydrogenase expression
MTTTGKIPLDPQMDFAKFAQVSDASKEAVDENSPVAYYCKDCKDLVSAEHDKSKKLQFVCPHCNGKNIALGTEGALQSFYHLK